MKSTPDPRPRRIILVILGALFCIGALVVMLVEVSETVSGSCILGPARRWELSELRPGSLSTGTNDLLAGEWRDYRVYQFDRPSFVDLSVARISSQSHPSHEVSAGTLIASAQSTSLTLELIEKRNDLADARAELDILHAGSKPAVIEQADLAVRQAQAAFATHGLLLERHRKMFAEDLYTAEELEISEARYDHLQLDVEVALAKQLELSTGSNQAKVQKGQTRVSSLERELQALEDMSRALEIRTPIRGQISLREKGSKLLSVTQCDTIIARILVPQRNAMKPRVGQVLKVAIPGLPGDTAMGEVLRIDPQITLTDAGPFITIYGLLENTDHRLVAGMMGKARIVGPECSLWSLLKLEMTSVIRQEVLSR